MKQVKFNTMFSAFNPETSEIRAFNALHAESNQKLWLCSQQVQHATGVFASQTPQEGVTVSMDLDAPDFIQAQASNFFNCLRERMQGGDWLLVPKSPVVRVGESGESLFKCPSVMDAAKLGIFPNVCLCPDTEGMEFKDTISLDYWDVPIVLNNEDGIMSIMVDGVAYADPSAAKKAAIAASNRAAEELDSLVETIRCKVLSIAISSSHGRYIPKLFTEEFEKSSEVSQEDWDACQDPDAEGFWDAWNNVVENWKDDQGRILHHSDDLWLVDATTLEQYQYPENVIEAFWESF